MNPKEKAQEIFDRFYELPMIYATAKDCALIEIDEILIVCEKEITHCSDKTYFYWQEVKLEIEKL
jgi:hypothetical protein